MATNNKIDPKDLGINLASKRESELFKWFLACLLFGKPIQSDVARRAYHELKRANLITPQAILRAGWEKLVRVLDRGHYVRFDFSTADKLLEVSESLLDRYGTLRAMLKQIDSPRKAKVAVQEFRGIGPVTARVFVSEIANYGVFPAK